jgi:hypothetical protein
MENINDPHKHLDALRCHVQAQSDALESLQRDFAEQAEYLRRRDQFQCLDELRERLEQEIERIEDRETAASLDFKDSKMKMGLLSFVAMNLAGLVFRLKEHPMKIGARLLINELDNTSPYGTIMLGVGANGLPDDVHVLPISEYARQWHISETEVKAELEARGYRLFTREAFFEFLDQLKDGIRRGTECLPAAKVSTTIKLVPYRIGINKQD